MLKTLSFIFLLFGVVACATAPKQTEKLLADHSGIPERAKVRNVTFIKQSENYCGSATLAMAMGSAGLKVDQEELATKAYTTSQAGALQGDMIGASRRMGLVTVEVRTMPDLLLELASGRPVIVLQNLSFPWLPKWHYALITGYDLEDVRVDMISGDRPHHSMNMRAFEPTWEIANHWGLVVLPPGVLSVTAGELAHTTAAAGLEQVGHFKNAELTYLAVLKKWPQSLTALIGLGNTHYQRKDLERARRFLHEATEFHPQSSIAWHNLATVQGELGQSKAAHESAVRALETAPDEGTREAYRRGLRPWL